MDTILMIFRADMIRQGYCPDCGMGKLDKYYQCPNCFYDATTERAEYIVYTRQLIEEED